MKIPHLDIPFQSAEKIKTSGGIGGVVLGVFVSVGIGVTIGLAAVLQGGGDAIKGTINNAGVYLPPKHSSVWPAAKVSESRAERDRALGFPELTPVANLIESEGSEGLEAVEASVENPVEIEQQEVTKSPVKPQKKVVKKTSKVASIEKHNESTGGQRTVKKSRPLDLIRSDPARIYIEDFIRHRNITFGVRNVSPKHGIEVWVARDELSSGVTYFPKARTDKNEGEFEGGMITSGQRFYGWIQEADLKDQDRITIYFSAAGVPEKKVTVRLKW